MPDSYGSAASRGCRYLLVNLHQTGTPAPSDRVIRRCGPVRTTQLLVPTSFFLPAAKSRGLHLPSPASAGLIFTAGEVSLAQARLCNCCPRLQPLGVIVALPPIRFMSADRQQSCVMSELNVTGLGSAGAPVRPQYFAACQQRRAAVHARGELCRLLRGGQVLPPPAAPTSRMVQARYKAGLHNSGAVVIGTFAFLAYQGLLGVKWPPQVAAASGRNPRCRSRQ